MDKRKEFYARVRHDIFLRAQCNEIIRVSKGSVFPKELYAHLKLIHIHNASILCIALTSTEKYIDEILLNKEHLFRSVKFIERVKEFTEKTRCKKLYIAVNTKIADTVFPFEIYRCTIEKVSSYAALKRIAVESKIFDQSSATEIYEK